MKKFETKIHQNVYQLFLLLVCVLIGNSSINASDVDLELKMPYQSQSPGMKCSLDLDITNYGDSKSNARLYLALNIGTDEYWFYPDWVKYPDDVSWTNLQIPRGYSGSMEIIPEFSWPEDVGSYNGLTFWAAINDPLGVISNLEMIEFEYVEKPEIRSISPGTGSPGTILNITGSGFDPTAHSIQVQIGSYRLNALTLGTDSHGYVTVSAVVPPLTPGSYQVKVILDSQLTDAVELEITDFQAPGIPPDEVMVDFRTGFTNLCSIYELQIIPQAVTLGIIDKVNQHIYQDTIQRSLNIFLGFSDLFDSLNPTDQQLLTQLLKSSDFYTVLMDIETPSSFGNEMTPSEWLLAMDTTSAAFEVLETSFEAMKKNLFLHLHLTSATEVEIASIVTGCHMAFCMLDYLIDGFIPSELTSLGFQELGPQDSLNLPIEEPASYTVKGIFQAQDEPFSKSFDDVLNVYLSGHPSWFDEYKNLVSQSLTDVIEGLGHQLTDSYLGEELLGLGSPEEQEFPLVINRFDEPFNLATDLGCSVFKSSQNMLSDLMNTFTDFSCKTGLKATCSTCDNCLETQLDQEVMTFRSLDCSTDDRELYLWFFWYVYNSDSSFTDIETPEPQRLSIRYETDCDIPKGFSFIPPGTFLMGTPETEMCRYDDEGPLHEVTISKGFYMKHTEVTQNQWLKYFDRNPAYHQDGSRPVELVSWSWAIVYCNRQSESEGFMPCYYIDAMHTSLYEEDNVKEETVYWKQDANGYRLPTEAEWEYACRAGSSGPYYNSKTNISCLGHDKNLSPLAWYWDNATFYTKPVARKQPNRWNLYDMLGNVREWCWDIYSSDYYGQSPAVDPLGPDEGHGHSIRGGSFDDYADFVRCGYRINFSHDLYSIRTGFRVVRSLN